MSKRSTRPQPRPRPGKIADHGYPRPLLVRRDWNSLNGQWDFAIDEPGKWSRPEQVRWNRKIIVPFAPESPASGVKETGFFQAVWYRRTLEAPRLTAGQRLILHFGAVDYAATVYLNGQLVARHEGGYTPFSADITDHLTRGKNQTLIVRAEDDPHDLAKPRGKQDWERDPHSIWYYRTTGIWQTVWLERLPANAIASLTWVPDVAQWQISLEAGIDGPDRDDLRLRVRLHKGDNPLSDDIYSVDHGHVQRRINLIDPGIDDLRSRLMWTPESPNLIDAELELLDSKDRVIDRVSSYTALRSAEVQRNRFILNNRPYHLRMVLDQGYWPEGGLTAPDDAAYRRDVELAKEMGFNGVRKHQKIESPRYLYWADRLGLIVWEEMPSPYRFSDRTVRRTTQQWMEAILRDRSHPCIVTWVPFNESWGVPDLTHSEKQRDLVRALYRLTKSLDGTRPVISNDGWEATETDMIGIHDYDNDPRRMSGRYRTEAQSVEDLFDYERPGHRMLLLDEVEYAGQPILLTEFGGIAYSTSGKTWGYSRAESSEELAERYTKLLEAVRALPLLSGFCYTQFTDTYQEANGLLTMNREPKFPLDRMAQATTGPRGPRSHILEHVWMDGY
jgi:beta-galactosidase/beta-glucuronidase